MWLIREENTGTMSSTSFEELMHSARMAEAGAMQVQILDEAIRMADELRDEERGYRARFLMIEAATFAGYLEKALIAFSWCLAHRDQLPPERQSSDLLWRYKWILGSLPEFPQVPLERIELLFEDFERRLVQRGLSLRPVRYLRFRVALKMGHHEVADRLLNEWSHLDRDWLADCQACETHALVWYHAQHGQLEKALRISQPLWSGKLSCTTVPQQTFATLLLPLVQAGQLDQAEEAYRKVRRKIDGKRNHVDDVSLCLIYATGLHHSAALIKALERHWPLLDDHIVELSSLRLFQASALIFERFASRKARQRRVVLPAHFSIFNPSHQYRPVDLADWFHQESARLANRFDTRNQNSWETDQFQHWQRLLQTLPEPTNVSDHSAEPS